MALTSRYKAVSHLDCAVTLNAPPYDISGSTYIVTFTRWKRLVDELIHNLEQCSMWMHWIWLDCAKASFCMFELEPGSPHCSELWLFHSYLLLIYFSFLPYWPVSWGHVAHVFKKNVLCQQLTGQQKSWVYHWAYGVVNGWVNIYLEAECILHVNLMFSPL